MVVHAIYLHVGQRPFIRTSIVPIHRVSVTDTFTDYDLSHYFVVVRVGNPSNNSNYNLALALQRVVSDLTPLLSPEKTAT